MNQVIGGSVNDNGTFKIKESTLEKILTCPKLICKVKEAQETKSKTQNLADKAAAWLFYIALGACITHSLVWLASVKDFEYALEKREW